MSMKNKSFLIIGYGREGKSVHKYLLSKYPNAKIEIADKKILGEGYLDKINDYDVIIRSPGISFKDPGIQEAIKNGKVVTSPTNIFFPEVPGKIIGITGTKGKSTTSALISNILENKHNDVRLVGNIGSPALDYLEKANNKTIFVMELSSYQLEDIKYSPHLAVILDIFPEHLHYHGKFEDYIEAKKAIVKYQTVKDIVVFNPEHEISASLASISKGHKYRFCVKKQEEINCYIEKDTIYTEISGKKEMIMPVDEIPLLSPANLENALAAVLVGVIIGVPSNQIRISIKKFKPLPHRLEYVGEFNKIRFYNDSLATTPQSTINALQALGDVETLIAGGFDRGVDYSKLGEFIVKTKIKNLILFPETGKKIGELVESSSIKKYDVSSMEEAVKLAYDLTSPGSICLLSPGSASFNLFRDYEERGNLFKKYVKELA